MAMKQPRPRNGLKFVLSLGLIVGSTAYALLQNNSAAASLPAVSSAAPGATTPTKKVAVTTAPPPTVVQKPAPTPTPTPTPTPAPAPKPKGQYVDGSYTGSVADAYYGLVQVKAIISGGKLTDVQFLQYPSDRSTSREINSQAMPLLTQEAVQAQSANVDGVSGASDTSAAFVQSLASALSKAKA